MKKSQLPVFVKYMVDVGARVHSDSQGTYTLPGPNLIVQVDIMDMRNCGVYLAFRGTHKPLSQRDFAGSESVSLRNL